MLPAQFSLEWHYMALYCLHLYRLHTPTIHHHVSAGDWDRRAKGAAERAATELRNSYVVAGSMCRWAYRNVF